MKASDIKARTTYVAETGVIMIPMPERRVRDFSPNCFWVRTAVPLGSVDTVADEWDRWGYADHATALRMVAAEVVA